MDKTDGRFDNIQISIGEGEAYSVDAACGWMIGILGGGLTGAYVESVLKRAETLCRVDKGIAEGQAVLKEPINQ